MLKGILSVIFTFLWLNAWSQADIDALICFPDYGKAITNDGARIIKRLHRSPNYVALKEVVTLDEHFRPIKIVYGENLFMNDTTDIIHVDFSRINEGLIFRTDTIFRSSPFLHVKVFDKNGDVLYRRKTDTKGGMVVKKIYTIDSISAKVTTVYVYDMDTIYNEDALIPLHYPELTIDDYGATGIKYETKLKVFNYEKSENKILTKDKKGNSLQEIVLENGAIKSIQVYQDIPSYEQLEYDKHNRVKTIEERDITGRLVERREFDYEKTKGRIRQVKIITPTDEKELHYLYPEGRADSVIKIIENYSIDNRRKPILNNTMRFSKYDFLVWYSYYINTGKDNSMLLTDEYLLSK